MEGNPITCGNCGTENPPGEPVCQGCGQPLTQSGGLDMRARGEAQTEDGFFGVDDGEGDVDRSGLPDSTPHRDT